MRHDHRRQREREWETGRKSEGRTEWGEKGWRGLWLRCWKRRTCKDAYEAAGSLENHRDCRNNARGEIDGVRAEKKRETLKKQSPPISFESAHEQLFSWLTRALPGRPKLDPGVDIDAKTLSDAKSPKTKTPFLTPSLSTPHNATRVPEWTARLSAFYYASRRSDRAFGPSVHRAHPSWKEICFGESERYWTMDRRERNEREREGEGEHLGRMSRERLNWLGSAEEGRGGGYTRRQQREEVLSLKFKLALLVSKDTELFPSWLSFPVSVSHHPSYTRLFSFPLFLPLSLSLTSLALIKSLFFVA